LALDYKDHYQTLGLAPGATAEQIKKAWRKLVLDLHPDKTGNDPALAARFTDIQQSYEVLSDPIKKIQYLQERWLRKAQGQPAPSDTVDLAGWIKACLALERKCTTQDPDRMDLQGLSEEIERNIAADKIATLQSYAHPEALLTGARLLLKAATLLTLPLFLRVQEKLTKIEPHNQRWQKELAKALRYKKREQYRNRYRIVILVVLTLLLCWLIAR
jgi:molecular chaperone DnaJ